MLSTGPALRGIEGANEAAGIHPGGEVQLITPGAGVATNTPGATDQVRDGVYRRTDRNNHMRRKTVAEAAVERTSDPPRGRCARTSATVERQ